MTATMQQLFSIWINMSVSSIGQVGNKMLDEMNSEKFFHFSFLKHLKHFEKFVLSSCFIITQTKPKQQILSVGKQLIC